MHVHRLDRLYTSKRGHIGLLYSLSGLKYTYMTHYFHQQVRRLELLAQLVKTRESFFSINYNECTEANWDKWLWFVYNCSCDFPVM